MYRVLFAIGQTPFDPTSGAAQATLHLAELFAQQGLEVRSLATTGTEGLFRGNLPQGDFNENGVQHSILAVDPERKHSWHHLVGRAYDARFDELLAVFRPDFVFTFGDEPPDQSRRTRAMAAGAKVVFCLHNEAYQRHQPDHVSGFLSPSQYLAKAYRRFWSRGAPLNIKVLPTPFITRRVLAEAWEPVFLTFVNPQPTKGLWFMLRIAEQLGQEHPSIPLRIVEGRATAADFLGAARFANLDLTSYPNLFFSPATADVREIWATTRLLLAPAVWHEPAGRTAVEAMMHGAVPIVSDRGGLAEQLGPAGRVLSLPHLLTPTSGYLPTPSEVAPWLEAVVELCHDNFAFQEASRAALQRAKNFSEASLAPQYLAFLESFF